jgi:hypothetical protein
MKFFLKAFILLFILLSSFATGEKTICFKGKVIDENGIPLQNVRILLGDYKPDTCFTDKNGWYVFQNIPIHSQYQIIASKDEFLSRGLRYWQDTLQIKDTVFNSITLRSRKCATINTSEIGENDLGVRLKDAIKKFKLDTAECWIQTEPPGIARGIKSESGDSTVIYLQFERTVNDHTFKTIMNKKITGIGLVFPDCTQKMFGSGFVFGIYSSYCVDKK